MPISLRSRTSWSAGRGCWPRCCRANPPDGRPRRPSGTSSIAATRSPTTFCSASTAHSSRRSIGRTSTRWPYRSTTSWTRSMRRRRSSGCTAFDRRAARRARAGADHRRPRPSRSSGRGSRWSSGPACTSSRGRNQPPRERGRPDPRRGPRRLFDEEQRRDRGHQVEGNPRPPRGRHRPLRGRRQRDSRASSSSTPRRHGPLDSALLVVIALVLLALVFDYINGFHDAANSIATVVSTRVLSPGKAVIWAAFFNFVAAFAFGTAVAKTVGSGHGRPQRRHLRRDRRRAHRRHRLEPDHLVLRAAHELVARAVRRIRRGGGGQGRASRPSSRPAGRRRSSSSSSPRWSAWSSGSA